MYTPSSWVIVEIFDPSETATGPIYKVLAGWGGSYLSGSSWRLNSGITKVISEDDLGTIVFNIYGHSGSIYRVEETSYGLKMSTAPIANQLTGLGCKILNETEAFDILFRLEHVQQTV